MHIFKSATVAKKKTQKYISHLTALLSARKKPNKCQKSCGNKVKLKTQ